MTDQQPAEIEALARSLQKRASDITGSQDYAISYSLVLHPLAQLGEEMEDFAAEVLKLVAEVRRLRKEAA